MISKCKQPPNILTIAPVIEKSNHAEYAAIGCMSILVHDVVAVAGFS